MYTDRNKEKDTDNGFIYSIVNKLILIIYYVNIVELFKWIATKLIHVTNSNATDIDSIKRKTRKSKSNATDIFIVFKFIFVFYTIYFQKETLPYVLILFYLLFMNSFTYFYYHVWHEDAIKGRNFTTRRMRRRFISLLQSIMFMVFLYSYMYKVAYKGYFDTGDENISFVEAFMFSLSNTFPFNYTGVTVIDTNGEIIVLSQVLMSFLFISIILSQSLPNASSK